MNIKDMSYDTLRRWVTLNADGAANKLMSLDAQLTNERQKLAECVDTLMYVINELTPDVDNETRP